MNAPDAEDPYDLQRFVRAQQDEYRSALEEIQRGRKHSHWMWFIFPQFAGLGLSETSLHYSIKSMEEVHAYLEHPLLGPRLRECAETLCRIPDRTATEILGHPDDLKLQSCATLFALALPAGSVFERILDRFYEGKRDPRTLELVGVE